MGYGIFSIHNPGYRVRKLLIFRIQDIQAFYWIPADGVLRILKSSSPGLQSAVKLETEKSYSLPLSQRYTIQTVTQLG